jgi:hypothetical protein
LSGSLLELGGIAVNCVEFGTPNGETIFVAVLLSKMNVAVYGSATVEGLSYVRLWPTLTSICCGINAVNGAVEFPPPACTVMDDAVVDELLLLLLLLVSCALMSLKLVVAVSSVIDSATMTATTTNIDFIVIGAGKQIV